MKYIPRNWQNVFAVMRFAYPQYIKVLFHTVISPTGAKNTVYYEKLLTHPSPNPAMKLFSHYNGQTVGLGEGCVGS